MMTSKAAYMTCGSLALLLTAQGPAHAHGYTFESVATLDGIHEGDFEPQDINNRGDVLFASDVSEPGATEPTGEGLFLRRRGTTYEIARTGKPAPGTTTNFGGGFASGVLSPTGMNNTGDVAFGFLLEPSTELFGVPGGVFRYNIASKTVTPVSVPGDQDRQGNTVVGSFYHSDINNNGVVAASMIIRTDQGYCQTGACAGLGRAVYVVGPLNRLRKIVAPGDPAPGTALFDDAYDASINDHGDVVFGGHVADKPCFGFDGTTNIGCFSNLYLSRGNTARILPIAQTGDAAPGGGRFKIAFAAMLNNHKEVAFIGSTGPDPFATNTGVYLWRQSGLVKVAIEDDDLDGVAMRRATASGCCVDINNWGAVAFAAQLKADVNDDGFEDTGVFVKRGGNLWKVVRSGDILPGIGIVQHVNWTYAVQFLGGLPTPNVNINDHGQVLTQVILDNGENHVIVATPQSR